MKPHRTDGVSLSFGLIFLAVVLWWAVAQVTTVRLPALGWLAAGSLILIGAVGLLSAIRSGRRTEVTAPVSADPVVAPETDSAGDLPTELHADIVRELMSDLPATTPELTGPDTVAGPDRGQRPE